MDVREFLTSAQQQLQENSEVGYRNAASRAYYCAFHLCRMLLEKLPQPQDNIGTSHQKIIDALFLSPATESHKPDRFSKPVRFCIVPTLQRHNSKS